MLDGAECRVRVRALARQRREGARGGGVTRGRNGGALRPSLLNTAGAELLCGAALWSVGSDRAALCPC